MPIVDVDSHFIEPWDWLDVRFPELGKKMPKSNFANFFFELVGGEALASLPPEARPTRDEFFDETSTPFNKRFGDEMLTRMEIHERMKDLDEASGGAVGKAANAPGAYGDPARRGQYMTEMGIDIQFINDSFGFEPARLARDVLKDPQIERECMEAYNTWASEQVIGHTDRQIPVSKIILDDVDWAVREVTRMRALGSRGVQVPGMPVNGKSIAHPDFDRFWAACADLGVAVIFHVLHTGRATLAPGTANMGNWAGAVALYQTQSHQVPEVALGSMVLGGVLERHPKLVVMAQEMDIGWVPYWVSKMDGITDIGLFRRHYKLPLRPSEYVERQIFISGLAPTDAKSLRYAVEASPPNTIVFASDWPHPEGGPIETARSTWERELDGAPQPVIEAFLGTAIARAMELA